MGDRIGLVKKTGTEREVLVDEIEIFKESQKTDIHENTDDQVEVLSFGTRRLNQPSRDIIDHDRDQQNEDITGNEGHVESDAGAKQKSDAKTVRKEKIEGRHQRKKDEKTEGVERHSPY